MDEITTQGRNALLVLFAITYRRDRVGGLKSAFSASLWEGVGGRANLSGHKARIAGPNHSPSRRSSTPVQRSDEDLRVLSKQGQRVRFLRNSDAKKLFRSTAKETRRAFATWTSWPVANVGVGARKPPFAALAHSRLGKTGASKRGYQYLPNKSNLYRAGTRTLSGTNNGRPCSAGAWARQLWGIPFLRCAP